MQDFFHQRYVCSAGWSSKQLENILGGTNHLRFSHGILPPKKCVPGNHIFVPFKRDGENVIPSKVVGGLAKPGAEESVTETNLQPRKNVCLFQFLKCPAFAFSWSRIKGCWCVKWPPNNLVIFFPAKKKKTPPFSPLYVDREDSPNHLAWKRGESFPT